MARASSRLHKTKGLRGFLSFPGGQFLLHRAHLHLGVAEELRGRLVSADKGHLGHVETDLEQARDRFVAKIVKVEIADPGARIPVY